MLLPLSLISCPVDLLSLRQIINLASRLLYVMILTQDRFVSVALFRDSSALQFRGYLLLPPHLLFPVVVVKANPPDTTGREALF